ncbi:uncharacterized protein LOC106712980 [Papilio machaon]|uniref:uncharacterized protein LOC106712980 n=1 Tax=Papilio machaon TaxID=76193 RepID=UPI001E6656AD|nr:uncharacterized protein LOC106712980 [Papilio machaon]
MEPVDNNIFEVKANLKNKRKRIVPNSNIFLNPALDLLANEDPMCNNAMEITPGKRRKRTKSCDIVAFENTALDLGISKTAVNEFLIRELENVRKNVRTYESPVKLNNENPIPCTSEPLYANMTEITTQQTTDPINTTSNIFEIQNGTDSSLSTAESDSGISIIEQRSLNAVTTDLDADLSINNVTNIQSNVTNQIFVNNTSNLNLSFIDRLALNSPSDPNQSLYLDDDLNESNIMEIKTITIVTKKKRLPKKCTNPFLDPNLNTNIETNIDNPFTFNDESKSEMEYNIEAINRPVTNAVLIRNIIPRTLFTGDTNSTISTVNESVTNTDTNEYENIDSYRADSPIYENIEDATNSAYNYNKQSKILGHDVSRFSAVDILNLNKNNDVNFSTDSNDSKKDSKNIFKINKLSKKVMKTLKKTFKSEKVEHNTTLNPYEVPRKPTKLKTPIKESGIENPGLNLDNSDEIEIEEIEEDNQYETIKTIRNTRLNMNVTPLKERNDIANVSNTKPNTPGKKVRFDSTLNREKIITGDSFEVQSPGLDAKIDNYHDELENCINEKKFLQQNM